VAIRIEPGNGLKIPATMTIDAIKNDFLFDSITVTDLGYDPGRVASRTDVLPVPRWRLAV
jgi:hypothetical protein